MDSLRQRAVEQKEYMVALRRHFHKYPELSWKEIETTGRIRQELDQMGIHWEAVCETATVGVIPGKPGAPVIGLRADIDALPIQEETQAPYASVVPGVMHACGHDAHTAILLGAAKLLKEMGEELTATVKLIFQPAEEIVDGAEMMSNHPLLEDLDNIVGLHVWSSIPTGEISIQPGPRMASADTFEIDILGKSGHGAAPHTGIDTVHIASMLETGLQAVVSRQVNPLEPVVVSVGTIKAGTALNIIAPKAELVGTIRTFSRQLRAELPGKIEHMAKHIALAFGATAEFRLTPGAPPVINDDFSARIGAECAALAAGSGKLAYIEKSTGAEDFAYFLEKVPGAYAYIGCASPAGQETAPHHHGKFDINEDCLVDGAAFFLHYVLRMQKELTTAQS